MRYKQKFAEKSAGKNESKTHFPVSSAIRMRQDFFFDNYN